MLNSSNCSAEMADDLGFSLSDYFEDFNASLWNASNASDYESPEWCEAGEHETFTIKTFQSCVFALVFLLGVGGNLLVIATFALYRRLRLRSMTDVFLVHLALADLLLLLTLPLQAVETHRGWVFPGPLCKATRACYAVNTYSGLLLLASISVDRYMVVARAQDVLRLRRRILAGGKLAALGVWAAAVLLSLPEILFSGVSANASGPHCGLTRSGGAKTATNAALIGVFGLSLLVMVACYARVALVLWGGGGGPGGARRGKQWHRQRTLKLMLALVLVFLLFQLPYTVVLSRKMAGQFCALLLEYVTCTLAYARCCLNPILYALVGVRFRSDVLRLLHDSGCLAGLGWLRPPPPPQSLSSASPSSPALTALSTCSPSSNESGAPAKFHFPGTKYK